jgi:hypothetical protein
MQSIVFYIQVAINVAPFYPPSWDQAGYLVNAYDLVATMRDFGIGSGLRESLTSGGPNGVLFPLQGALLSLFLGMGRAGVLTVNLVLFLLLQLLVFWLVKWKTHRNSDAWLSVALVLLVNSPFLYAGGIFDFRIDFFALCAMGIWACVVLRSGVFRNLWWSIVAGLVGAWLVCTRHISFVYLVLTLGVLFMAYAIAWLGAKTRFRRAAAWIRGRNILASGLITAGCVSPFLWINRNIIYDYYFVTMFVNDEKELRAKLLELETLGEHLLFYPSSILFDHLGSPLLAACGVLLIWSCLYACVYQHRGLADLWQSIRRQRHAFLFLSAVILVPLAFLNLSVSKSPVVGGILSIPILLIVAVMMSALPDRKAVSSGDHSEFLRSGWIGSSYLAGGFVVIGLLVFMYRAGEPKSGLQYVDRAAINDIYDKIIRHVVENGNTSASISADRITDYLHASVLMVASYERFGRSTRFRQLFPADVLASSREDALKQFADSDIVMLTDPVERRAEPFPLNSSIREYRGELQSMVTANFLPLTSATIQGIHLEVFAKPILKISGVSGAWVTSAGLIIEVEASDLTKRPIIVLKGEAPYHLLDGELQPRATVIDTARQPIGELPVTFEPDGFRYVLSINARAAASETPTRVRIQLSFNRFFIPSAVGWNADMRELVIVAPSRYELREAPRD